MQFSSIQSHPKITKILTDSDIDGIMCAAIFTKVYPNCEIVFGDPSGVQEGQFDNYVDDTTVVMDLPYIKGCGLYFDHHSSNKPNYEFQGVWAATPSAARVLYEYYKDSADLSNLADMVDDVDIYDSGAMKYQDVKQPGFIFKLAWAIEKRDKEFFAFLVDKLGKSNLAELENDSIISNKIALVENKIALLRKQLPQYILLKGKITLIDLRGTDFMDVHISVIESELMQAEVVIMIKENHQRIKFSLYQNNLLELPYEYDLLAVAKQINPLYSGGHKKGCGLALPAKMSLDECIEQLVNLINKQSHA